MSGIQKELGPRGFETLFGAVNDDADIPSFVKQWMPAFPVGRASSMNALEYLQWPKDQRPFVPLMVFIDRSGMIRAQFSGADSTFFDEHQDQHIREQAEKLLAEKAPPVPTKARTKRAAAR